MRKSPRRIKDNGRLAQVRALEGFKTEIWNYESEGLKSLSFLVKDQIIPSIKKIFLQSTDFLPVGLMTFVPQA